ncbi:hypothetical protein NW063_03995 [Mycoplasmopsis cynos]|uniref:hypothetical protein n=1 Tax=Mycoplasmopsis cynos TaxID=171284 RepID=UPI0021FAFF62|nr:hypothetical protein [Mycoplasmopsis cynos]UWV85991.1 hypothetical protein NW063_03995 [Mycoplasmopsis cynos]
MSAFELDINLQKIGINSNAFKDFRSFLLVSTVQYNEHQTIILFSKSCETKEREHLIDVFQEQKNNFFLITANKSMREIYQNVIIYQTLEQDKQLVLISSKINQQFISDLILFLIFKYKSNELDAIYDKNRKILYGWNKQKIIFLNSTI